MDLTRIIRTIPDYPKPGIQFRDITTLLADGPGFSHCVDQLAERFSDAEVSAVAGIEARGFILGGAIARALQVGFVPVRKRGKLPHDTLIEEYELEYGVDAVEIHVDAVSPDQRILVVDDLVATGGTALAAISLLRRAGADIVGCAFVIDLPDLGGAQRIRDAGAPVTALIAFDGE